MNFKFFAFIAFLSLSLTAFSQENGNTIEDQFVDVVDKSNNYQEFKVIKKSKINVLRKNILDSVAALESTITTTYSEIDSQKTEIATLKESLASTKSNLTVSKEKEDGIELLGILTQKSTYNSIMWSIVLILLAILVFLFYKFKNSHAVTKAAKLKFDEIESEFDAHRRKTLENEQQLRRKLQDEINKNRNVS